MSEFDQTTRMVDDIRTLFGTAEIAEAARLMSRGSKAPRCEVPRGRSVDAC